MIDDKPDPTAAGYVYDPTPGRVKHRWDKNYAGFIDVKGKSTGKCPNDIRLSEAQRLLNEAVEPERLRQQRENSDDSFSSVVYPQRLYNVFRGVVYEAWGDGATPYYHGYPARHLKRLPKDVVEELKRRAEACGHGRAFEKWMKEHA